jgi:hypothetical protein
VGIADAWLDDIEALRAARDRIADLEAELAKVTAERDKALGWLQEAADAFEDKGHTIMAKRYRNLAAAVIQPANNVYGAFLNVDLF